MACRDEEGASCSEVAPSLHKLCKFDAADSNGAEWRSWEQLEASPASTSPPWDSGDDDSPGSCVSGSRPSDLYGKFTWKIEKFSQISKRELRSSVFEVGGYRWYILVYPQGCDVCNHLSLFLCVADYDKLLPGWTHFAQFTIAVVNKDPKKSKYSDTLHRFCKKEHDWGWKKFMELSKVLDGFTVADTLVIKAQVQVIRENPHRPFRCLDCQYRRELIRVYLTNVEGICRRFMEEKREKIGKLMEDPVRWSSFRAFWSSVEENVRRRLSREKIEVILKVIVKTFFNEKEVTSTLVMDALYSGCKVLDYCGKNKKGTINGVVMEEAANPVVHVDKETFVLAGDVLTLLERTANESLPPYKDDKAPQNRTKDCNSGDDFGKDTVERDERRLTELGRRTVEMFVLAHLFSNRVEVAYLEAIALKRQEELIREEEAAGQAEIELKARREAAEKEKRTKKKQAKQRRNKCKDKDKELNPKGSAIAQLQELQHREGSANNRDSDVSMLKGAVVSNADLREEDDDSSVLDTTDGIVGTLRPAVDDGDADNAMWEREGFETHYMMEASFSGGSCLNFVQNGRLGHQIILDDSSSTCSSDSIPPINGTFNGSSRRRSNMTDQRHISANRGLFRASGTYEKESRYVDMDGTPWSRLGTVAATEPSCSSGDLDAETIITSLKKRVQRLQQRLQEKEEEVVSLHGQLSFYKLKYASDPEQKCDSTVCEQRLGTPERESLDVAQTQINIEAEMQTTGRATGKDAAVITGSSSVSMSSLTDLKDTAVSQPQTVGTCDVPEVRSSSAALAQLSGSSEDSVASPIGDTAETNLSRPSSAPDVAELPKANFSSTQQLHPSAHPLTRSTSATGRLGITTSERTTISPAAQQALSATQSYRNNTAAGVIQGNSSIAPSSPFVAAPLAGGGIRPYVNTHTNGGTPNGLSHPMAGGPGFRDSPASLKSYSQTIPSVCAPQTAQGANAITGTEGVPAEGISALGLDNRYPGPSRSNMGFTFGTLTPEILRLQHQQDQGHHYTNGTSLHMELQSQTHTFYQEQRPIQHRSKSGAHCLDFMKTSNDILHNGIDQAGRIWQATHTSAEASTSGVVMSEFPHLDIINELLDDDKMLNAFLQQPGIQSLPRHLSYHDIHRLCNGQFPVEISVLAEGLDKSDRGLHSEDSLRIPFLRESIQLLHPATHPHLPRSFSHHNCSVDGMVGQPWPVTNNDFPIHSCMNGTQNGLDVFMGYPFQSPHLPFGDCPAFAVGQNGYPMYSPIKHP